MPVKVEFNKDEDWIDENVPTKNDDQGYYFRDMFLPTPTFHRDVKNKV